MKKTAFIITAFIILFVLSAQVCMAEDVYKDTLRVGLSYGASAKETATFYSNDDIAVYDVNTGGGIAYISAGTPITLTATGGIVASDQFYYYTDVVRLESIGTIFYNLVSVTGYCFKVTPDVHFSILLADICKSRYFFSFKFNLFIPHGCGSYPNAAIFI